MYYGTLSKKDKENKLHILMKQKEGMEEGKEPYGNKESREMIAAWKTFLKLPYAEQAHQRQSWKEYYAECRKTMSYEIYEACKQALKENNLPRLRELIKELHEMRVNEAIAYLPTPSKIDPWEFERGWAKAYRDCELLIKTLRAELDIPSAEEAASVWGQGE